jgi:hypothetical protein
VNKLLTKTQRERILGVIIGTPIVMAMLWYFVVQAEQIKLKASGQKLAGVQQKLAKAETVMRQEVAIADTLQARGDLLAKREATLAPDRDAYAWIISTINPFILNRKGVSIYAYTQPDVSDQGLLSDFPYRWATFHLKGTGFYQEFGAFFADLENSFPYFRVQNLEVSANTGPGVEAEKLNFSFDLITPVVTTESK